MHDLPLAGPVIFAAASYRARRSVDLDCAPDVLFDVFEDADAWPRWVMPIKRVEWTSPMPPREGTTRTVHMHGGMAADERFTSYDRGRHMQFVFTRFAQPTLAGLGEDYRVEDRGAGRCRLTWTLAMEPTGIAKATMVPFAPLMPVVLGRMLSSLAGYVRTHAPIDA